MLEPETANGLNAPEFLDADESAVIESFEAAIYSGTFKPSSQAEQDAARARWRAIVEASAAGAPRAARET